MGTWPGESFLFLRPTFYSSCIQAEIFGRKQQLGVCAGRPQKQAAAASNSPNPLP